MKKSFMYYYSIVLLSFTILVVFSELLQGIDIESNVYAIGMFAPVLVWLLMQGHKNK